MNLPLQITLLRMEAFSKEGVLSVHIPKTETSKQKPKQITVQ
jgi:HSP20 family molecular chaperone IbpA